MFDKLKVEKVELVKRVIRQNNYDHYEKTHRQCIELGLNINRAALDRFANKLELIDKAQLSKRQQELHKLDIAAQEARESRRQSGMSKPIYQQSVGADAYGSSESTERLKGASAPAPVQAFQQDLLQRSEPIVSRSTKPSLHTRQNKELTLEQVKQRETEITFELGELKIRENELLQELIRLTELLDKKQKN